MTDHSLSIRTVAYLGVSLAILEISKVVLDFIPNVELVTLLFIIYTIFFGRNTYLVALGFVAIECFLKGINIWTLMYLYIWPLLITIVYLANKKKAGYIFYSILSGLFGLFFGLFCSIPNLFIGGLNIAVTWWIAGIPYDVIHCVSNFLICLVLFRPLSAAMKRIMGYRETDHQ